MATAICRWRSDGQGDFFQDGDEGEEEQELEMFEESIDRFELSGWRPRRLCCDYMAGCSAGRWGCTYCAWRVRSFTRLPFLEHFVDVPVPQITDELLNEVDAAVRRVRGEEARRRRRSWCSSAPDAAPWHDGGYADTALKTVAARRLWRLRGGEADFPRRGGSSSDR